MNNWIFAGAVDCVCVHCGYSERVPMRDGVAYFKHICRTVPPDLTRAKPVAKPEWHKFKKTQRRRK